MFKYRKQNKLLNTFISLLLAFSILNTYLVGIFALGSGTVVVQLREYKNGVVTDISIPNASFELRKLDDPSFSLEKSTDTTGNCTFSGLEAGEYEVIQRTTPDTYKLPSTNTTVKLEKDNSHATVVVSNVKRNSMDMIKIVDGGRTSTTLKLKACSNSDESIPIVGASFLVTSSENGVRTTITTNPDGIATLPGLTYGHYTVTQISSPEGFLASPNEANFEIQRPSNQGYDEFANVHFFNEPYNVDSYGKLYINVADSADHNKPIPNVKLLITDDLGNSFVSSTDSNGSITFKNFSKDRTYSAKIIESPYEYEYSGASVEGNIKLNQETNSNTISMYLPKKQANLVTIVNHEMGDLSVRISGSRFRLIHPDGSQRELQISNTNGELQIQLPSSTDRDYILEQLTTDGRHIISKKLSFSVGRPATVYVPNNLINPNEEKVSFSFTKEWVDKPSSNQRVVVRLMQNGSVYGNSQHFTLDSNNGPQTKNFTNLPKYDSEHIAFNYSVKEDPVDGWYAQYEEVAKNNWKISNYEGSMTGQCLIDPNKGLIWFSGENSAFMMENGVDIKKTINFPTHSDPTFGYGIAYDRTNGYLYGANRRGDLAIMDPTRGENGYTVNVVKLGGIRERTGDGTDESGKFLHDNGQEIFVHRDFRKLNCLETSVDGKYLFAKVLADPNIYMYRISDILSNNVAYGGEVPYYKVIHAKHNVAQTSSINTPVSDGDIIQYPNGDILYSGHGMYFFRGELTSPQRGDYNFYLLKYNGPVDSNGNVIDSGEGSYSEPINVGRLRTPGVFNSSWDANNWDTSIEGMTYAFDQIWFTSVVVENKKVTKRLARITGSQPNRGKLPNRYTENTVFEAETLGGEHAAKIQALPTSTFADMTGGNREICLSEVIVRGAKTWMGDNEGTRPKSIEVQLYADGSPYVYQNGNSSKLTLNEANGWKYQFSQLPKYDSSNKKIEYSVKEINTPAGYISTTTDYSITNTLAKGGFYIKKMNENKSVSLSGAKFSLLNEAKDTVIQSSTETDSDGIAGFNNLPAGTYYLREDAAPESYEKAAEEYRAVGTLNQATQKVDFEIFKGNQKVELLSDKHVIKNSKPKFNIKLVKADSKTGRKITTASRFAIVDSNGNTINEQVAALSNGEFTFDNGGNGFEAGTYYIKEVAAPKGYKQINRLIPITISNDGRVYINTSDDGVVDAYGTNVTGTSTVEIKLKNEKIKSKLVFAKRIKGIEETGAHGITEKVRFKLTKDSDTDFSAVEIEKRFNEKFVFENLTEGVYTLEETKAPNGYVVDTVSYRVVVDGVGNVYLCSKSNSEASKPITSKDVIKSEDLSNIRQGTIANAIDGSDTTAVVFHEFNNQGNNIPVGAYIGVDLRKLYEIKNISFLQGAPSNAADRFNNFSLEYSADGDNWMEYKRYTETDTTKHVTKPVNNINEANPGIFERYIRFKNNEVMHNVWFGVKEIRVEGLEYKLIKEMTPQMQNQDTDDSLALIGNIQNPSLVLEKIDANTSTVISENNAGLGYNAKFRLYKVGDNVTSVSENELKSLSPVQELTLNAGRVSLTQLADKLGRYALVEVESPAGYKKVDPILLDLIETQQVHSMAQMKNTTAWKPVEGTTGATIGESGGYTTFTGVAKNEKIIVDYTKLSGNKITLKVKNDRQDKPIRLKIRKVDDEGALITATNRNDASRFLILDSDKNVYNDQMANLLKGEVTFDNKGNKFRTGLYHLKEERAPKGYLLINTEIPFYIKDSGDVIIPAKLKDGSNSEYEVDEQFAYKNHLKVIQSADTDIVEISVENKKGVFPYTGGIGTLLYLSTGILLMGTAVMSMKLRRKSKN
ncbi:SpaA isopeptide-forming pilin-related protein [Peptostreptococcus sp. D1]|uniref:SpaA isopeptide-forming pilin-related protein n=1 Tax=Peptostreptococcus sp. D1 TaxID=72304 RepID=UPI0008EDE12E|nr:SpaA isopeptide-forming pilin-related protein [Peptostreptococcus sp. D1]SFE54646.1 Cna protein B-type domain-containing protein [Peptostreptococcus sp. D1]